MTERNKEDGGDNEPIRITKGVPFTLPSSLIDAGPQRIEVDGIRAKEALQGDVEIGTVTDLYKLHAEETPINFPLGSPLVALSIEDDRIVLNPETALLTVDISVENLRMREYKELQINIHYAGRILLGVPLPIDDVQVIGHGVTDFIVGFWVDPEKEDIEAIENGPNRMSCFPQPESFLDNAQFVIEYEDTK